jgi:hypothetical protein
MQAAITVPTWEQVLRTIYQVRCNLFHGQKSPENARDGELILKSHMILRAFLAETGCLEVRLIRWSACSTKAPRRLLCT